MILTRKVALAVAGVAAAGVLGTAGVAAGSSAPAPAPASNPAAAGSTATPATPAAPTAPTAAGSTAAAPGTGPAERKRVRPALQARGMHGEWVVKGKDGPVTLVSVRGTVTAVGPAGVTVKADDGFTATFAVDADTRVRGAGVDSIADVKVGARGAVVGVEDGTTVTARAVVIRR